MWLPCAGHGDYIIKALVEMPEKLDKKTIEIVRALDMSVDKKEYAKRKTYVEKMNKL